MRWWQLSELLYGQRPDHAGFLMTRNITDEGVGSSRRVDHDLLAFARCHLDLDSEVLNHEGMQGARPCSES